MAKQKGDRLETVNMATLSDLDGGIAGHIGDKAIAAAIADFVDRAKEDGKPRVVTLKITFELYDGLPVVRFSAGVTMPAYQSNVTVCKERFAGRQAMLEFAPNSSENPDQRTIVDEELAEGEVAE